MTNLKIHDARMIHLFANINNEKKSFPNELEDIPFQTRIIISKLDIKHLGGHEKYDLAINTQVAHSDG